MRSALAALLVASSATALDNGLALKPTMGWRSWNCFKGAVNDTVVRSAVDAMVSRKRTVGSEPTSLADLGYSTVGVDDGWQACGAGPKGSFHASDGTPLVNQSTFPDLKGLVDYSHKAGVGIGWYHINCICMDTYTLRDNATWAGLAWAANVRQLRDAGFDGVKIDNCGDDDGNGYVQMARHINASGRPLLLENSNQAHGHGPPRGLPNDTDWCPFNMFRSGGDIGPDFGNTMAKLQTTIPFQGDPPISRPGCWAYPDMLEVGNFNTSPAALSLTESKTHFSAWCIVSSPLILGLDVTNEALLDSVWDIVSNKAAIAVNQAWAGHPGRLVKTLGAVQIWAKRLSSSSQAVLFINTGSVAVNASVALSSLGLEGRFRVSDIWRPDLIIPVATADISVSQLGQHDSFFVTLSPDK